MGNFALHAHPLVDFVELTVQRMDSSSNDTFTVSTIRSSQVPIAINYQLQLPYRSRFGTVAKTFEDSSSYRERNCMATQKTNGVDMYDTSPKAYDRYPAPIAHFQQQPSVGPEDSRKHPMNVMLDTLPLTDIDLPEHLQPKLPALEQSYSVAQFFMLNDNRTGVLALGSFSAKSFSAFGHSLLNGLQELRARGAKNLIVDVVSMLCLNCSVHLSYLYWFGRLTTVEVSLSHPTSSLC